MNIFNCLSGAISFCIGSSPENKESDANSQCEYLPPRQASDENLFNQILSESMQTDKSVADIASYLHEIKDDCHQFTFKYPLFNADHALTFAKVMEIKAQEAHRFVPVFSDCRFIEEANLGFIRQADVKGGPTIQEHVLVDSGAHTVIFVEQFVRLPNGQEIPGAFAAINQVVEEEGCWYFSGAYLYAEEPSLDKIQERKEMFRKTYDNMIDFIQRDDVEAVYASLQLY